MTEQVKSHSISFRVWHPLRRAEDISAKLQMTPVIAHDVGRPRVTPNGTRREGNWRKTCCVYDITRHVPGHFTDGLEQCIGALEARADVFDEMAAEGAVLEFYVWIDPDEETNLGFTLDADLAKRIGKLHFRLRVEICL